MAEMTQEQFARLGGYARAKKLSKKRRIAIARKAAIARWDKHAKHYGTKKR
jgi:hypothetical protein